MGCLGAQLVARVEHHPVAVDDTDPAGGDELRAGVDPTDLAPAEPDQLDRAGAVVQLTLQGRDAAARVGLYHLAWEVGTLADLDEVRRRLDERGALVGASDHRVSKSLYAKDPSGIEFEVMWRVPAEDWEAELASGPMIAPLDLAAAQARWGDRVTGAAAGSVT